MIALPDKIKKIETSDYKGIFEFSPLYPGYGVTIGNALRRILLSSIEGAAITTVKIKDISHEFSTIEGVLEDVIDIILNIKQIRLKCFSEEPVMMHLKANGEGQVTAGDIKAGSDVEIINKKQPIATLTGKKAVLEMELVAEKGVGYVPVEQRQKEKISVGTLAIDAVFSPVRNTNFTVENIRVGQRTDYNKLILEIETDGTITPEKALRSAVDILNEHLKKIYEGLEEIENNEESKSLKAEEEKEEKKKKPVKVAVKKK